VLAISFGVVLIFLALSSFSLLILVPLVPLLLLTAGRALILRKVSTGVEILSALAGISLALVVWGDWNFDLTDLRLRSQAILWWHIQRHHDREQASQLWEKVRAIVDESRHSENPQAQDKAFRELRSMVFAIEKGWILQGLADAKTAI
jgi:hypothetical protein